MAKIFSDMICRPLEYNIQTQHVRLQTKITYTVDYDTTRLERIRIDGSATHPSKTKQLE